MSAGAVQPELVIVGGVSGLLACVLPLTRPQGVLLTPLIRQHRTIRESKVLGSMYVLWPPAMVNMAMHVFVEGRRSSWLAPP